ncbi:hypothetical protein [Methylobacterium radiodurans]|uniref:Uncharacterized protein n=1 Tax=Methylobacterium radiodurans TaxID=2202828 RepID=A0A2U8VTM8_9HYPH|nr:hypothetical protein [Methylobacterium radiodurans]AWN36758.1 hypothetical protein DK427_14295 [Methylobacterium radiodurans]
MFDMIVQEVLRAALRSTGLGLLILAVLLASCAILYAFRGGKLGSVREDISCILGLDRPIVSTPAIVLFVSLLAVGLAYLLR